MSTWHYTHDGAVRNGPVSTETMAELIAKGDLHANTLVWQPSMTEWQKIGDSALGQLFTKHSPASPPPQPPSSPAISTDWSELLRADGPAVDAKAMVAPGTTLHTTIAWIAVLIIAPVLLVMMINPGVFIVVIVSVISAFFLRARMRARIHGSAIQVSQNQFPEIHACVQAYSQRLGLKETPATYVFEASFINAIAMKIGGRGYVMLTDDIVDACARTGNMRTLRFIIGHEVAHHALGHTGFIRAWMRQINSRLSRLDEFSCDAIGAELNGDKETSAGALLLLITGPQLHHRLNLAAVDAQAAEVIADKHTLKAERKQSHPLLLRRYFAIKNGWRQVAP